MVQTLEATIDETGRVSRLEPVRLPAWHRALVTILEEQEDDLTPVQTHAEMTAAHLARCHRLAPGGAGYVSIDLPFIDDGADW